MKLLNHIYLLVQYNKKMLIDGPVNVAKLKGNIDGINKDIIIFMDIHQHVSEQNNCASFDSVDISHYLKNTLGKYSKNNSDNKNKSKKYIDIFYEGFYEELNYHLHGQRYIDKLLDLFISIYDNVDSADHIMYSKILPTTRIHLIDIRNLFNELINNDIMAFKDYSLEIFKRRFDYSDIFKLLELCNLIKNNTELIKDMFTGKFKEDKSNKNKKNNAIDILGIKNIVDKILFQHKNEKNRKIFSKIIETHLLPLFTEVNKYSEKYIKECNILLKKMNSNPGTYRKRTNNKTDITYSDFTDSELLNVAAKLYEIQDEIHIYQLKLSVLIMDLYLLRRMVNLDSITKILTYTGISHSTNYIYLLTKYYSFELINISNTYKNASIKDITNTIKKSNDIYSVKEHIFPEYLKQCSDISNFDII